MYLHQRRKPSTLLSHLITPNTSACWVAKRLFSTLKLQMKVDGSRGTQAVLLELNFSISDADFTSHPAQVKRPTETGHHCVVAYCALVVKEEQTNSDGQQIVAELGCSRYFSRKETPAFPNIVLSHVMWVKKQNKNHCFWVTFRNSQCTAGMWDIPEYHRSVSCESSWLSFLLVYSPGSSVLRTYGLCSSSEPMDTWSRVNLNTDMNNLYQYMYTYIYIFVCIVVVMNGTHRWDSHWRWSTAQCSTVLFGHWSRSPLPPAAEWPLGWTFLKIFRIWHCKKISAWKYNRMYFIRAM